MFSLGPGGPRFMDTALWVARERIPSGGER